MLLAIGHIVIPEAVKPIRLACFQLSGDVDQLVLHGPGRVELHTHGQSVVVQTRGQGDRRQASVVGSVAKLAVSELTGFAGHNYPAAASA